MGFIYKKNDVPPFFYVICLFRAILFLPVNTVWSLNARDTSRIVIQISWQLKFKLGPGDIAQLVEFLPGLHKAKTRALQTGYGCIHL